MTSRSILRLTVLALLAAACSSTGAALEGDTSEYSAPTRDWVQHPAIVQIATANEIFAISDPHGALLPLGNLLAANHLIDHAPPDLLHASDVKWTGGTGILVVAGDLIDKGPESLGVIDLLRALETQAPSVGGRVVVTMGNHEAEFFLDPKNSKATSTGEEANGIDNQLDELGMKPKDLAAGRDPEGRGLWLRNLPFGVQIKNWFFSHGGNTAGDSLVELSQRLQKSVDHHGYSDNDITGPDSILEAQGWYGDPDKDSTAKKNADALGVKHIVFGHDPGALDDRGDIACSKDEVLVKLDVSLGMKMSSKNPAGQILHVFTVGKDSAEVLDGKGQARPLL